MTFSKCIVLRSVVILASSVSLGPAWGQTRIARSGSTVVNAASEGARAVVKIEAVQLEGDFARACPSSRVWLDWGAKQVSVVEKMEISINDHPVAIPLSVYASLFEPHTASLRFDKGSFVLRIDGADGSESYFLLLYFDSTGVTQLKVYDSEFPDHPTQVTRFYLKVVG